MPFQTLALIATSHTPSHNYTRLPQQDIVPHRISSKFTTKHTDLIKYNNISFQTILLNLICMKHKTAVRKRQSNNNKSSVSPERRKHVLEESNLPKPRGEMDLLVIKSFVCIESNIHVCDVATSKQTPKTR